MIYSDVARHYGSIVSAGANRDTDATAQNEQATVHLDCSVLAVTAQLGTCVDAPTTLFSDWITITLIVRRRAFRTWLLVSEGI